MSVGSTERPKSGAPASPAQSPMSPEGTPCRVENREVAGLFSEQSGRWGRFGRGRAPSEGKKEGKPAVVDTVTQYR